MALRTQEDSLINYCQFIIKNASWEHQNGRATQSKVPHAFSGYITLSALQCVHQSGSFLNPIVQGLLRGGGSFCRHDWLNPWSLVINSIASPSPIPRGRGGGDLLVPPLMIPWSFWWPAPILKLLRPPATTYLTSIQKTRHLGHSKGFRICVPVT